MSKVDKIKVQINLNADMVSKIDEYAQKIGTTRSGLCSYWIAIGLGKDFEWVYKKISGVD